MVLFGQFLERPSVFRSGQYHLEALSHRGDKRPALLICPPHPSYGSSMDSPVCAEIAFAASRSGFPTFRFNYRGAGASEGPLSDRQACVEDAAAALDALERNVGHGELAVVGYDFGALVAMDLARSSFKIRQIAVVAPRTGDRVNEIDDALFAPPEAERFGLARLALVGELDPALVAIKRLSARNWEVETVASADHVFTSGLPELGRKLIAFLEAAG